MLRHRPAALCLLCLATVLFLPRSGCACTRAERDSLLSFLSNISTPAERPLRSWAANTDCCLWEGISCGGDGSVTRLWLPGRGLGGTISPSSLDGLARLAELNLSYNRLSGMLPRDLLWSDHIVVLDVSYNLLSGQLPPPSSPPLGDASAAWSPNRIRPIRSLNVSSNRLTGELPRLWEQAPELRAVNASNNSFSGPILIPPSICSVSPRLNVLDLSRNGFGGVVPRGLGKCSELVVLEAGFNYLSGQLPADLCDAIRLQRLSLPYNQLTGVLAGECISKLTNLVVLDLGGNSLRGELPGDIGKLTNLEELRLNENRLSGTFPSALTNCTRIRCLDLRRNNLTGDISTVDFSPLSQLGILDLGDNNFAGEFPASIYSCTSLTALRLSRNTLRGRIAPDMQRLQALSYLSLSFNTLEGISEALRILGSCGNLTVLLLSWNFNGEAMPDTGSDADWPIDAFTNLRVLSLWGCQLTGKVPSWMARLGGLQVLDLSGNQLTGTIPGWLGSLPNLFYLELSDNLLSGELPSEITRMKALQSDGAVVQVGRSYVGLPLFRSLRLLYNRLSDFPPVLNLTNNSLSGTIPPGIGLLKRLHILNLSRNNFSGEIPVQVCNLSNLEVLNLSRNHLSGPIPPMLSRLHFLSSFSVAFNDLSGPIPSGGQFNNFPNSSFEGNNDLCGSILQRPCNNSSGNDRLTQYKRPKKKILLVVILITVFGGAFLSIILLVLCMTSGKRSKTSRLRGGGDDDVMDVEATSSCNSNIPDPHHAVTEDSKVAILSPGDGEMRNLTISDIMKATNNFHQDNIVGCGSFGSVYKANLPDGSKLAIKRLVGDMGLKEREFAAEVEALSTAQHKNLVSLRGYYVRGSFRLLVYSFMENGSLDYWLHEADEGSAAAALDWPARLRIAQGVSQGLSYIHQICEPHIIHRDIKSSNILLDEEFEAHLADFGLSRLMLSHNTHVTTELVGTLGYIPPEYGQAWVATLRGDIYSFGVVLLELLTGRRPIDPFKSRQSRELVGWVQQMKCQGEQGQVFDPRLRDKGLEEEMSQVLDIACLCVNHNPLKRPTIQEVVGRLANVSVNEYAVKQIDLTDAAHASLRCIG